MPSRSSLCTLHSALGFHPFLAIPCNCVIMKIQMVLSGDGQPHSSIWKEIRLLLEAGGGFLYARIATMITKRITKKVKKSYFVIGHHPISGARFDRLPYRQHRVQYNISAWDPATEAHPQKSPVKGPFITAFDRGSGAGAASGTCFFTIYGKFHCTGGAAICAHGAPMEFSGAGNHGNPWFSRLPDQLEKGQPSPSGGGFFRVHRSSFVRQRP